MTGSTYLPQRWADVEAAKISANVIGSTGTAAHGATTNIDILISDDNLIRGIELLAKSANFGDLITIQVIDIDAVYFPANTVLAIPVTNFNINSDTQKQADYQSVAPFRILGGLYFRIIYISTGGADVSVSVNFLLNKILI